MDNSAPRIDRSEVRETKARGLPLGTPVSDLRLVDDKVLYRKIRLCCLDFPYGNLITLRDKQTVTNEPSGRYDNQIDSGGWAHNP